MGLGAVLYNVFGWEFFSITDFKLGPGILWLLMVFSPTISALFLTYTFRGKEELQNLLKQYLKFKVNWIWYLAAFALLLVPLFVSVILKSFNVGGGAGIGPDLTLGSFVGYVIFGFFSGPFSEEMGWRGYALPRLQAKHNSFVSSLIIGLIWTPWHVPLAFVRGASQAELGVFGWIIYTILVLIL